MKLSNDGHVTSFKKVYKLYMAYFERGQYNYTYSYLIFCNVMPTTSFGFRCAICFVLRPDLIGFQKENRMILEGFT